MRRHAVGLGKAHDNPPGLHNLPGYVPGIYPRRSPVHRPQESLICCLVVSCLNALRKSLRLDAGSRSVVGRHISGFGGSRSVTDQDDEWKAVQAFVTYQSTFNLPLIDIGRQIAYMKTWMQESNRLARAAGLPESTPADLGVYRADAFL